MFLQQQLGIEIIGDEALFDNHKAYLKGYVEKCMYKKKKGTKYVLSIDIYNKGFLQRK